MDNIGVTLVRLDGKMIVLSQERMLACWNGEAYFSLISTINIEYWKKFDWKVLK